MRKIFAGIMSVLAAAVICSGCSDDSGKTDKAPSVPENIPAELTTLPPETEPPTEAIIRDIKPADGTYVYDNAGLLSKEQFSECNDYAGWLYETFLINAAVVTTDSLGEMTPEQYAEKAYVDIYSGRGSGLLLLINNDTNEDYIYKKGSCLTAIPESAQSNALYWATQEIVSGDYKSAIMRLMQLGEYCSQYVFDNGGIFTAEEIDALETACEGASGEYSVLATGNSTGSPNEEICRSYYQRHYKDTTGTMIMVDTESSSVLVMKDGEVLNDVSLADANTLAASGDYFGAVNALLAS